MTAKPPPIIHSAKLVAYAINDKDVLFTDRISLYVGGNGDMERLGEMPQLAICTQYPAHDEYLLFFCDEDWEPQGTIGYSSIEEAKLGAERGYQGITPKWIASTYSEIETADFLRNVYEVDPRANWWEMRCSFCGKLDIEVEGMLATGRASICKECVESFYQHFQGEEST